MQWVETRLLEGPNIFLLTPAVKLEFDTTDEQLSAGEVAKRLEGAGELIKAIHQRLGLTQPKVVWEAMETPGHYSLVFSWDRRGFAERLAGAVVRLVSSPDADMELLDEDFSTLLSAGATAD